MTAFFILTIFSKYLLLDAIGDLSFDQSFNQLESGEDHQYVIDFNNAFMLIGLVSVLSVTWLYNPNLFEYLAKHVLVASPLHSIHALPIAQRCILWTSASFLIFSSPG